MSDIKDGAATPGQAATLAELLDGWREELAEEPMYPDQHVVHATLSTVVEQLEAAIAAREPHAAPELPKVIGHPDDAAEEYLAETFEPGPLNESPGYEREHMIDAYHAGWDKAREQIAKFGKDENGRWRTLEPKPAPELAAAMAALEKVVSSHERVMYAAAIDIRHGQPGEARRLLGEQLDGWDGPEWDGTETGAQYLERTREVS